MLKFQRGTLALFALFFFTFPDTAEASRAITEFNTPFELVVGTITGPVGRLISICAMALCGVGYVMKREELTGGFKMLLGVVFGISFIAFAAGIVDRGFTFSGALI